MQKLSRYVVLDMGGTLNKVCFLSASQQTPIPHLPSLTVAIEDFSLYFKFFALVQECFDYLNTYFKNNDQYDTIAVTGGGAFKYKQQLSQFGKKIVNVKQFQSLIEGMNFFKAHSLTQFRLTKFHKGLQQGTTQEVPFSSIKTPFLIANIGSGVSVLKIEPINGNFECVRLGGTSLGGGYFMGLARLLLNETNFQNLLQLARNGQNDAVDYTPEDFPQAAGYLAQASVLVSLAKLTKDSKKEDIARSLIKMVSFNIAQIALMYSDLHEIEDLIFTGHFCRNNTFVLACFAEAINFFQHSNISSTTKRAYSLKHDGYLGTIGAIHRLMTAEDPQQLVVDQRQ